MRSTLIVHERLARWNRRLRHRVDGWGARIVESRSVDDLAAAANTSSLVVLIDPAGSPRAAFDALLTVRRVAPQALVLVIDEAMPADFLVVAREAGATLILPSTSTMPVVFDLIRRWLELARLRSQADGWAAGRRVDPEPWEALLRDEDREDLSATPNRRPTAI